MDVLDRKTEWSSWVDNHDGIVFGPRLFNKTKALADGLPMWDQGGKALRLYIPKTLWTFEWRDGQPVSNDPPAIPEDGCRDPTVTDEASTFDTPWQKVTFMTANLQAASDFATMVLGAVEYPSAAGTELPDGCPVARWFSLYDVPIALHFVDSRGYLAQQGVMGAERFAAHVEGLRNWSNGTVDPYIYNSWVVMVGSLDPYLTRVKRHGLQHLLVRVDSEQLALFIDVPQNAITVQLRSSHVSLAAPVGLAAASMGGEPPMAAVCAPQF